MGQTRKRNGTLAQTLRGLERDLVIARGSSREDILRAIAAIKRKMKKS